VTILVAVLGGLIAGALAMRFLVPLIHRQRIEEELRGDWWSRFERDFRAYAGTWRGRRDAEPSS